jgi:hypothetical protein
MVRSALEFALARESLDELFGRLAVKQYLRELLFSSLVGLMCQVVCGVRRSICAAYQQDSHNISVSLTSVYNKLQGVEDQVSAELLRCNAAKLKQVMEKIGPLHPPLLPKYPTRILDGNHLASTQHRLAELRTTRSGPLPGQALVVYDPDLSLIIDVFPCQDAHAQERSLVDQVLQRVRAGELWIDDRNFCTTLMLFGLACRGAFFAIGSPARLDAALDAAGPAALLRPGRQWPALRAGGAVGRSADGPEAVRATGDTAAGPAHQQRRVGDSRAEQPAA